MRIKTYAAMNEYLKDILRRSKEPMNLYILARIEELEAKLKEAELLAAELVVRHMDEPAPVPITRFDRIRACTSPEGMAMEMNKNERHFCPKAYGRKPQDCKIHCGKCITDWLKEEDHETTDNG